MLLVGHPWSRQDGPCSRCRPETRLSKPSFRAMERRWFWRARGWGLVGRIFKTNAAPVGASWMWPLDAAPLIRIHGQHPTGALRPGSVGAVTLKAFACSRALAFYRSSIGWSKLGLSVGGRSGDAVWLRRLLPRSEPLGAQPSLHLYHDAPRSEQTRSRPSTASIEAPLHSASATQIGPLETTTQTRGL